MTKHLAKYVNLTRLEVFERRQGSVAAYPCQFDEQRLPRRLELLCASLCGLIQFDCAGLDGFQQSALAFLGFLDLAIQLVDAFLLSIPGRLHVLAQLGHHHLQAFRCKDLIRQLCQYQFVEFFHRHIAAGAGVIALSMSAGAFVIAIPATLARDQRHGMAAYAALEQAGEQRRR